MSMFLESEENQSPAIVKLEGMPNNSGGHEPSRWQKFLSLIWPFTSFGGKWAKYGYGLSKTYVEAEVENKQNEAAKTAAEAAEISARADANRNQAAKLFGEQVDNIFKDVTLPETAKLLKLAKLMESNPELVEQIDKVTKLIESLRLLHGASVEIQTALKSPAGISDEIAT